MTTKEKVQALFQIALRLAHHEGNEVPSVEDKSRYTYAACAEYRRIYGKRATQTMIDKVRFDILWF